MKQILRFSLLLSFIFFLTVLPSQAQSKKGGKETEVSSQELQQMMNEMHKEIEKMDPEAKEMMKKMGIGMPDMNKLEFAISGNKNTSGPIPEPNEARIQKAGQTKVNSGNITDYVQRLHNAASARAGTVTANEAQEIYQSAKNNGSGAQAANGLWAFGANLPAVIVLGNVLSDDPKNADNLNNYSAFLIMTGFEEGALPILEYLNKSYPNNSTILNNIGQAWFGLGELKLAENYLDSAIWLYAGHSQANFTKSLIQESRGDKSGAITSMRRSIRTAYSKSKEERLKSLGYTLKGNDVTWHTSLPQDPLGFGQMNWPSYPKSVDESLALQKEWETFRQSVRQKSAVVYGKTGSAQAEFARSMEDPGKMMQNIMKTNLKMPQSIMPFEPKARAEMEYYKPDDDVKDLARYEQLLSDNDSLRKEILKLDQKLEKDLAELEKKMGKSIGEGGSSTQMKAYCQARNDISDKYLENVNSILEKENSKWLNYWRTTMSRRLNYYRYAMPEDAFELEKLRAQVTWLAMIGGQEVKFIDKCEIVRSDEQQKQNSRTLGDFYDMTCSEKSVMNLGIGSVIIECNKMTTEFEAWFIKYSSRENMDNGSIIKGTVEVSFGLGNTGRSFGPVKAEIGAGGSAFIEFDDNGVTDAGVKVSASAEIGTNVLPEGMPKEAGIREQKVTVLGSEARWGWNSGFSAEGKGFLSGLAIK